MLIDLEFLEAMLLTLNFGMPEIYVILIALTRGPETCKPLSLPQLVTKM